MVATLEILAILKKLRFISLVNSFKVTRLALCGSIGQVPYIYYLCVGNPGT